MTFDKKIRDKYAAGGYGIGSIFKDTIKFVNKNALLVVIIFSIIVSIIPAITGDGFLIERENAIEGEVEGLKSEIETTSPTAAVQRILESIATITFLVYFFRKAKGIEDSEPGVYGKAVGKSILMSMFLALIAIFPLMLFVIITMYMPIFMAVVAFLGIVFAYFISTAEIAVVNNPERKIMESLRIAFDTFKKPGYIKSVLLIALITFVLTFGMISVLNFAVFGNFEFGKTLDMISKIFESGAGGHILIFFISFVFNFIGYYFNAFVASAYLIYSEINDDFEEGIESFEEYKEEVLRNFDESESENKSSFFEEYEKNFYSGKNEEDDNK
ncbi:MAG: hypothetical protein SPI61_06885 [Ezakiella sp.]|uniref:hypothetical protein n=1 Tax=Ezakiella sp. TaxID=1935205 RepID=UPI00297522F4|nr:hypothetical protein [Ezakiella sp.]MDD7731640.1 hypothetical protein [Eubacteriales bacterium]MDY6080431.1 hypothetical protein [Ezakiella sp.]